MALKRIIAGWVLVILLVGCATMHNPHLEEARIYMQCNLPDRAIEELKLAVAEDSLNVQANYWLAGLYVEQEMWDDAVFFLERVAHLNPNYLSTNISLAKAYARTDAEKLDLKAFPEGADTSDPMLKQAIGFELYELGYFDRARDYLEQTCDLKDIDENHYYLARIYCSKKEFYKALHHLDIHLEKDPRDFSRAYLVMLLEDMDSVARAEEEAKAFFEISDNYYIRRDDKTNYQWEGHLFYLRGDFAVAESLWRIAVEQEPEADASYHNFATVNLASGDCEEWRKAYTEARKMCPNSIMHNIDVGLYLTRLGKSENALNAFYVTRNSWKYSGVCNGLIAYTLEKLGREEEAKRYWNLCILKTPGGTTRERCKQYIEMMVNNAMGCYGKE